MRSTKEMLTSIRKITPQDKNPRMPQRLQGKNSPEGPQGQVTKAALILAAALVSGCAASSAEQKENPDAGPNTLNAPDASFVELEGIDTDTDTGECENTAVLEPNTLVKTLTVPDTAEFSPGGVPLPPSDSYSQEIWADQETADFYEDDGNPSEENPGTLRITFDDSEFGGIPRTSPATGQSITRRIVQIEFNGELAHLVSFRDNSGIPNVPSKASIGVVRSSDTVYVGDTISLPDGYYLLVEGVIQPEDMDNCILTTRLFDANDIEIDSYDILEGSVLLNQFYSLHMHQGSEETGDSPAWAYVSVYGKYYSLVDGGPLEESGAKVNLHFGTAVVSTPEGEEETSTLQAIVLSVPACTDE